MKTRIIRRISQIVFAGLFMYLIFKMAYPVKSIIPVDLFTQIDPLLAGTAMIASRSIIHEGLLALSIVALTVLLGRVFCGWICPMGTALDASDKLFFRRKRNRRDVHLRQLKYYILGGLFVTALFTMQAVYLLDPFSILTRTVVVGFVAPLQMTLKWLLNFSYVWSSSSFGPLQATGTWVSDNLSQSDFVMGLQMYFRHSIIILGMFIGIVALNSMSRRFWCSNLCPLGALLGLLSRVPVLKRVVGTGCNECSRCAKDCKMGAIPENPRLTRTQECIECLECVKVCNKHAVRFKFRPRPEISKETGLDLSRRRVLQGAGVGLAFAAMAKIDPSRKRAAQAAQTKISSTDLLRPPGSVNEESFVERCIRCGNCMKTCPTNGLQPAIHEAGIEGFWTPVLVPRIGYCQQDCNACSQVCPTDAIEKFDIDEKSHLFIGTATIDRSRCMVWNSGRKCAVCHEYCSYGAVELKSVDGMERPHINETKCVGCGQCESACPIQPVAAIRVYSRGDKRNLTREQQKQIRDSAHSDHENGESGGKYPGLPY
ncbi:MAG: 4Fe-4S dicluster domain-containing protein [Armatimonadota bacterium]